MLTTFQSVRDLAGPTLTATDTQIKALISGISAHVHAILHRNLMAQEYTEYCSGDNSSILQLKNFPIISVSKVNYDPNGNFGQPAGSFASATDLVFGTDYVINEGWHGTGSNGQLLRLNYVWESSQVWSPGKVAMQKSPPRGNILVVYTAGYEIPPVDVQLATNLAVIRTLRSIPIGSSLASASYEDGSVSMVNPEDMAKVVGSVERILSSKRIPAV